MADPGQSGTRSFAAVVGALVAVVGVVLLVVRAGRPSEPVETGPAMTTVTIVSDPAGATVRDADGGVLGVAPFDLTIPKRDVDMPVVVSRDGYQDSRITVPLYSATGRIDVKLWAIGEKRPPPPPPLPKDWSP